MRTSRAVCDAAADKCFIARSVLFKVQHEPTFEIASGVRQPLPPFHRFLDCVFRVFQARAGRLAIVPDRGATPLRPSPR
jgi:hypothetical protein